MTSQTKTTTTANDARDRRTIRDEIAASFQHAEQSFEEAKKAFGDDFATNPEYAIRWKSGQAIYWQIRYEFWMHANAAVTTAHGADLAERIETLLEDNDRQIESFFGSNSTDLFTNAVERAKAEARVSLRREHYKMLRRLLDAHHQHDNEKP